jgi:hypothetical protein
MKRLSVLTVFSFLFSIGIAQAAPGDSIWILNPDTVGRQYNSYSVCDTNRNATGDTGCLPPSETHCDTGTTGAPDTQYIDYNYTMQNGYAGFKIDWDAGGSRYVVAGFDSLVIYHKGPLTGETVTINFGASVTCGQPTVFTKLGTFSGSSSWTREAFSLKSLPNDSGLYEMQVLINDSINPTASGNFKLGHMVFIKNIIKDQASSPALLTPADSALAQPLQVTLTWAKVPIATSYWVQVATSADFIGQTFSGDSILYYSNTVFSQSGLTSTSVTVSSGLLAGQPYYWQVLAANVNGMSPWATAWSFFTTTDPIGNSSSIPILVSPANKAAGQPLSVKLAWDSVKVATSYNVQVSTDAAFGSTVFSQTGIAATSVTVPDLSGSMTYYWRVAAADKSGTSAWSNPEVFSTTTSSSSKKNCGCGSGTGLALIPPIWLKARSSRRKKRQKTADV